MNYFEKNKEYWENGYSASNVDHTVFRFYGRILKQDFNFGSNYEKLLDFGCGQGAAVNFFSQHGFNARGVDISSTDIEVAKARYPHIASHFSICDPNPRNNSFYGFEDSISVATAFQSLYYFSDTDFQLAINKIYNSLKVGGVFFATMMGVQYTHFFENSVPHEDGLRVVNFKNERYEVKEYYMSFIEDEDHLKEKFSLFKPLHIGNYSAKFREDDGNGFHYTFCGVKE